MPTENLDESVKIVTYLDKHKVTEEVAGYQESVAGVLRHVA
jgi:hypothetical protein